MTSIPTTAIKLSPVDMEARKTLEMRAGDTVRVWVKIQEGKDKEGKAKFRLQAFEGLVLARKHGAELGATFTVRKVASGVGVERIFPLYSPVIDSIELVKRSQVRRSKLYYVREKVMREIRKKMKHTTMVRADTREAKPEAEAEVAEKSE